MAQRVSLGLVTVAAAGLLLGPSFVSRARACSVGSCINPAFFPSRGTLPANIAGIYWWPAHRFDGGEGPQGDGLQLARVDGAQVERVEVTLEPLPFELNQRDGFLVVPSTPFVEGARYVAWDDACRYEPFGDVPPEQPASVAYEPGGYLPELYQSAAFITIGPAAPLPSELGRLNATEPAAGFGSAAGGPGCSETGRAVVSDLSIELSAGAEPWRDALLYETRVDGALYRPTGAFYGEDWLVHAFVGYGIDRVYTLCEELDGVSTEGVDQGAHVALMRARVPGMDDWLTTNTESFELSCSGLPSEDGGLDESPDGSTLGPSEHYDAAVSPDARPRDAAVHEDARDADDDEPSSESSRPTPSASGGCACSATPTRELRDTSPIAIALLLLAQRRRRASS